MGNNLYLLLHYSQMLQAYPEYQKKILSCHRRDPRHVLSSSLSLSLVQLTPTLHVASSIYSSIAVSCIFPILLATIHALFHFDTALPARNMACHRGSKRYPVPFYVHTPSLRLGRTTEIRGRCLTGLLQDLGPRFPTLPRFPFFQFIPLFPNLAL